jgi:glycosyltransferase involved in cell wall biosynthesis
VDSIKVLHIIKSLGRGGAEMLLPETLKLHDRAKFDFHYIYFLDWKDEMVMPLSNAGGKVTCFAVKNNIGLLSKYKEVIQYCKSHQIQLIHCHLPWAGFLGRIIFSKTGLPVLYTEHNMQERYHSITKTLNKFSYNKQTKAFGVSDDVTKSIFENINPKIPVQTLLNGVNTKTFKKSTGISRIRKEYGIPENAIVIGNIAVFRFQKRLVEWLQVIKEVSKQQKDVYGILVGFGPLEKEIKNELNRLELQDIVFLPGLQRDVVPYYEAMDIFMMSSSFEGLPIALLEAMSMECAIITTNAGGIKEVIRNEEDGLVCDVDNWKDLAGLILEAIKDRECLNQLKVAARQRVVDSFSLSNMVELLEKEYLEITERNTGN